MSCSKQSAVKYLVDKNLVKPNMELYTPLPTNRLSKTIDRLTSLAKTKYGVDMGSLFAVKFRDIEVGNYLTLGSAATVTRVRLEPNDAAFEAIDRSEAQEAFNEQRQIDNYRIQKMGQYVREVEEIEREGNYIVNEDGEIVVPTSLPQINVRC
jgi:hypothetical protein